MKKLSLGLLCLAAVSQANAQSDEVSSANQNTTSLEERITSLESELASLKADTEADNKWLNVGGRLQIDFNAFDGAYNAENDGATATKLFPRRARISVDGERGDFEYKMILEFADETAEILLLRFEYHGFENGPTIKFGKIREDISLAALSSSKHLALIERSSVANTMSPYFRWGVAASQYFESTGLRYAFGVHKNDAFSASGSDEDGAMTLAYTGRLTWNTPLADGQLVHLGGWGSYREFGGDELGARFARAGIREPNTRLVDYAAGGEQVALDHLSQYGLEAAYQHDSLLVQSEYAVRDIATQDPASILDGESYQGYYVEASYMLTGETKEYKAGAGRFNQPKGVADAWEIAARASSMDATSEFQGTKAESYTLGVSYYIDTDTKIMLNGVHSKVSGPGTAALVGNETSGNALTARFHYDF